MDSLLHQINESALQRIEEDETISNNLDRLIKRVGLEVEQLNEAVTDYMEAAVRKIEAGDADPETKDQVASVFGAIAALSNPDIADAFDERGNLGEILGNMDASGKGIGNVAANQMKAIGDHPSVRSFKQQAKEAVDDPGRIRPFAQSMRIKIERVMNAKKHAASQKAQADAKSRQRDDMARPMQGAVPRASAPAPR